MDNVPDYIYFKDRDSRFTRINLALVKGLGLQEAGMALGKTDFDFFPEEDARQSFADDDGNHPNRLGNRRQGGRRSLARRPG